MLLRQINLLMYLKKTSVIQNLYGWISLSNLGMPSKIASSSSSVNIDLKIDSEICFNKLNVAEKFNDLYVNVASKLVEKLPTPAFKFGKKFVHSFYAFKGVLPDSFSLNIVSEKKSF